MCNIYDTWLEKTVEKGASVGHSEMQLMTWQWKDSPGSLQQRGTCGSLWLEHHQQCHGVVIRNGPAPWHGVSLSGMVSCVRKVRQPREAQEGSKAAVYSPKLYWKHPLRLMSPIGRSCDWESEVLGAMVQCRTVAENTFWTVASSHQSEASAELVRTWSRQITVYAVVLWDTTYKVYITFETDSCPVMQGLDNAGVHFYVE